MSNVKRYIYISPHLLYAAKIKRNKNLLNLLAIALIVKAKYRNSVLYEKRISKIGKTFHCSNKDFQAAINYGIEERFVEKTKNGFLLFHSLRSKDNMNIRVDVSDIAEIEEIPIRYIKKHLLNNLFVGNNFRLRVERDHQATKSERKDIHGCYAEGAKTPDWKMYSQKECAKMFHCSVSTAKKMIKCAQEDGYIKKHLNVTLYKSKDDIPQLVCGKHLVNAEGKHLVQYRNSYMATEKNHARMAITYDESIKERHDRKIQNRIDENLNHVQNRVRKNNVNDKALHAHAYNAGTCTYDVFTSAYSTCVGVDTRNGKSVYDKSLLDSVGIFASLL